MSTARYNGGPAFPEQVELAGYKGIKRDVPGMTLRDYFAAKAMQGVLANPNYKSEAEGPPVTQVLRAGRRHAKGT